MPRDTPVLPPNWPDNVTFLERLAYAPDFPPKLKLFLQPSSNVTRLPKNKLVKIQVISDRSHPANGQRGLFAAHKIPPSTHIIDYLGEVHADDRPESDYDISLIRVGGDAAAELGLECVGISVGIDAMVMGNQARFINDYRGIGVAKPNAEFRERVVDGAARMSVWSGAKAISKGEEILVSYGKSWWRWRTADAEAA